MTATAVWTDFGGVLTEPVDVTFTHFSDRVGVPVHALKEAMRLVGESYGTDSMGPLDIPLTPEPEWAQAVERELEDTFGVVADLQDFGDRWFEGRPANRAWLAEMEKVRAGGAFVGLLSNLPPSWERHRRHLIGDEAWDCMVFSYVVGTRKPEPEIFELAARRAGRAPGDCVLVDDVAKNVTGARAAGWQAVHFQDAAQAGAELEQLLNRKDA